ncbi:hypothetical protein [Streptomyces sp. NPDC006640]|uniref:hypothetical protein n=1 Tax=unclassified Streptomyces TaxID=2593676 RepID=UPI00369A3A2A
MIVRHEETDRDPAERLGDRICAAALRSIEQLEGNFTFEDVADRAGTSVDEVTACCHNSRTKLVLDVYGMHTWRMSEVLKYAPYDGNAEAALRHFVYSLCGLLAAAPVFLDALKSDKGSEEHVYDFVATVCELLYEDAEEKGATVSLILYGFIDRFSSMVSEGTDPALTLLEALR